MLTKSPVIAWGSVVVYLAAIFLLSHQTSPLGLTFPWPGLDGLVHGAEYALLSLLVAHAMRTLSSPWWRGHAIHAALLVVAVYGLSDELHQALIPGRSCELADWYADMAGGFIAQLAWVGWE